MGYDDDLTQEFAMTLHSQEEYSTTNVIRVLAIFLSLEIIIRMTTLPLGVRWIKEDK